MGYDTAMFVEQPVDEDMLCSICHSVQDRPTTACRNGHTFCAACLEGWEKRSNQCPDCRTDIPDNGNRILNRPLQTIIFKMTVRCPGRETHGSKRPRVEGVSKKEPCCDWQGPLGTYLEQHSVRECRFARVLCVCLQQVSVSEFKTHQETACPLRMVPCTANGCDVKVKQRDLKRHLLLSCPETEVACPNCNEKMLRKLLGASDYSFDKKELTYTGHFEVCPKLRVWCEFKSQGCCEYIAREDLDDHHAKFARKHAKLVADELRSIREEKYWTATSLVWTIPEGIVRRMSNSYIPESEWVRVGDYKVVLALVRIGDKVQARVCVAGSPLVPSIDRLTINLFGENALEMLYERKMNKEDSLRDNSYSIGGFLSIKEINDAGESSTRDCVIEDLLGHSIVVIRAGFRLKRPDSIQLDCQL